MIIVAGQEAADNTDLLGDTLLKTIPANGTLLFEIQAADCDGTNFATCSIQLPDNSQPLNAVLVPCGNTLALPGAIDERTALRVRFRIEQGGSCSFSVDETGATIISWRVIYKPFR